MLNCNIIIEEFVLALKMLHGVVEIYWYTDMDNFWSDTFESWKEWNSFQQHLFIGSDPSWCKEYFHQNFALQ